VFVEPLLVALMAYLEDWMDGLATYSYQ